MPWPCDHTVRWPSRNSAKAQDGAIEACATYGRETVTCLIPGHHRSGRELFTDLLDVSDGPLEFELSGVCAYESTFEYSARD